MLVLIAGISLLLIDEYDTLTLEKSGKTICKESFGALQ